MESGNSQSGVCKATVNYRLEGKSTGFIGTETRRYFRVVKDIDIVSINCALFTADIVSDPR